MAASAGVVDLTLSDGDSGDEDASSHIMNPPPSESVPAKVKSETEEAGRDCVSDSEHESAAGAVKKKSSKKLAPLVWRRNHAQMIHARESSEKGKLSRASLDQEISRLGEPWKDYELLKSSVVEYARRRDTSGGGFGIHFGSTKAPSQTAKGAGTVRTCKCANWKQGCSWMTAFEYCEEGWVVAYGDGRHTLDDCLTHTLGASLARRCTRAGIPEEFVHFGETLKLSGEFPSGIDRIFREHAKRQNLEVSWTYDDIKNLFGKAPGELAMDSTQFLDWLNRRKSEFSLHSNTQSDDSGRLKNAFWVMEDGWEIWCALGDCTVVLFDTTHGTN
mmetsp:Transcript_1383/g.2760  ORF Transcript_1383/g.2760 Transcript_1383/m.2760 type:complete len:331 (+) Transcript_1383:33-1025(+)